MQHDSKSSFKFSSQCKSRLDTVNLVDFKCKTGGSTRKTMLKRHYKNTSIKYDHMSSHIITYHHNSSQFITYHHVIPRFSRNDHWKAHRHLVKPSRTLHRAGSHHTTITRATWATSGQKPVLTQDDPGTFMAS